MLPPWMPFKHPHETRTWHCRHRNWHFVGMQFEQQGNSSQAVPVMKSTWICFLLNLLNVLLSFTNAPTFILYISLKLLILNNNKTFCWNVIIEDQLSIVVSIYRDRDSLMRRHFDDTAWGHKENQERSRKGELNRCLFSYKSSSIHIQ